MSDTAEVTLRFERETSDGGKSYTVHLDGDRIGSVEQVMVTHDRAPRGSMIVTRRTRSLRWKARPGSLWDWQETRWRAVAQLVRDRLDVSWTEAERLARAAQVVKPKT